MKNILNTKNIQEIYPLSPMQEGMYFHALLDEKSASYFEQVSYQHHGFLIPRLVERSLNVLLKRHDVLRTVFNHKKGGRPLQVVLKERDIDFNFENISALSPDEKISYLKDYREKDKKRSFRLDEDVLIRVALFQKDDKDFTFQWSFHHILMDGWCAGIVMAEFAEIYNSLFYGRETYLPIARPYKHYIQWLEKKQKDISEKYWQAYLQDYEITACLPKMKVIPGNGNSYKNAQIVFELEKEKTDVLKELSARHHITASTIIQTIWGIILAKYNNANDVVFGSVVSGRPSQVDGVETMVGLFINTIPFRVSFEENTKFAVLLEHMQQKAVEGEAHHYLPLAEIQAESALKQNLLDHIFIFENYPVQKFLNYSKETKGINFQITDLEVFEQTNYDLNIVAGLADQLFLKFAFNENVYDIEFIRQISRHFSLIINQLITNETIEIRQLQLLTDLEKEYLLCTFNNSTIDFPSYGTLHQLVDEQADKTPDGIALEFEDEKLTYKELREQSNQLARYLKDNYAVMPGDLVGVMVHRSKWMIISILGILKAGAAYIPIDPEYPEERVSFMFDNSSVKTLIVDNPHVKCTKEDIKVFSIVEEWRAIKQLSVTSPDVLCTPEDLAYIIYTSGSTGQPKGVMIEHKGAVNIVLDHIMQFKVRPTDKIIQFASLSFDVSVFEIFMTLASGATLVLVKKEIITDPEKYIAYLKSHEISIAAMTPVYLSALSFDSLTSLRVIITGGESANVSTACNFSQYIDYFNAYGPTECAICVSTFKVSPKDSNRPRIPIGRPVSNMNLYILDKNDQLAPAGMTGEICVAGVGLSRGYLKCPDLTDQKFIPNPFDAGTKMYRTGDLGRWLPDGNIDFLGRKDSQVKVRGYRIELEEINTILLNHPAVEDALVIAVDRESNKELVAYFLCKATINVAELRTYLKEYLPEYMVPGYFVQLEAFPMNANGKINKKMLPSPEGAGLESGIPYIQPRTELEENIAEIWKEILGRDKIGVQDSFFELGGHSLRATRLVSLIYKKLNAKIELRELFATPTIEGIAKLLSGSPSTSSKAAYEPIEPMAKQDFYEVSHAQKRLWILHELDEDKVAYNMPGAFILEGELHMNAFKQAFFTIVARHESLRTNFITIEGELKQYIHDPQSFDFDVQYLDLRQCTDKKNKAKLLANEESATPFDLEKDPLIRIKLAQLENHKYLFLITLHHIISDGWSMGVLIKEIRTLYSAFCENNSNPLSPLSIHYKDYTHWHNKTLSGDKMEKQRQYWINKLSGPIPVLELPTDYARPREKTFNGDYIHFTLEKEIALALNELSHKNHSSLFMTMLATVKALFYKYSGQEDVLIGSLIAGREHSYLDDQIGFFVNTLALRTSFDGNKGFLNLLAKVKETTLGAYENQQYPFDQLIETLNLDRDVSRSPLFDIMMALQNTELEGVEQEFLKGTTFEPFDLEVATSKFDLLLDFRESSEGISGIIGYNTDLFKKESIERMLDHYKNLLTSILKESRKPLNELQYLSEEEISEQLLGFNKNPVRYPKHKSLKELFEEQVAKTPEAIAVRFEGQELSYRELNKLSNQLAHYLREKYELKGDDLVGLMVDRSERMLIGMLGILKSGAAYVPIDPNYPEDRISYILEDASVKALLVDSQVQIEQYGLRKYNPVSFSEDWSSISACSQADMAAVHKPHHMAYVIYTSGSTGKPKGVMVEHRNAVRLFINEDFRFSFGSEDVWTFFHSISFDFSVWEIFGALLFGGKVIVVPKQVAQSPEEFVNLLEREGVTVLNQIPAMFTSVVSEVLERKERADLKLRYVIFGGEALTPASLKGWREAYPQTKLINMYGITETTVHVTYKEIGEEEISTGASNIGKAIPTLQIYIMDEKRQLVAEGVTGEIMVGGEGVSRGYLNRKELTRERFITNPYHPTERLYCSGDLGRRLKGGDIVYMGRKDNQVKIRGHRIELGEIENTAIKFSWLNEVVATTFADVDGSLQLMLCFTTTSNVTAKEVKDYLENHLPDYMVPSRVVKMDRFPLSANGKIDRKALLSSEFAREELSTEYMAPSNELEEKLTMIWEEVLVKSRIGVEDNFFDLGGHSLKATRLTTRIYKELGITVGLRELFNYPTIKELANNIIPEKERKSLVVKLSKVNPNLDKIFCIPPLAGSSTFFKDFAKNIEEDFTCYGLQYKGFEDEVPLDESIETMAESLLHEIIKINETPQEYTLLGYSMGAAVAFELAKKLEAFNKNVRLILIDLGTDHKSISRLEESELDKNFLDITQTEWGKSIDVGHTMRIKKLMLQNLSNMKRYKINGRIDGDIVVLEAKENAELAQMESWQHFTSGSVSHYYINGNHVTLFEARYLNELTSIVKEALRLIPA